ncbi:MAG: methionyl-tRNA formyltransferase [Acidobacteriia bacterium]|nr:methionyl-tRNA formyltransferase [Terriglobia bacterium]
MAFLGTPIFAVPALEAVASAGHRIEAVFTQPDRPKGRGNQLTASPVKEAALRLQLPVHQPERIRGPENVELLASMRLDAMVVVGYGQIIPQSIIDLVPLGIINVHASLLPKYRGAAPIQWAIANGEQRTGVTTMRINAGLDTGDVLQQWETAIGREETAPELSIRLAGAGAGLLLETLQGLAAETLQATPQDHSQATLAPILRKEDGLIDWQRPAHLIHARFRGFVPWPGAYTSFRGQTLQIRAAGMIGNEPTTATPGTIVVKGRRLLVACGDGSMLEILALQQEGRKRVSAEAFLNGQRLLENERLGATC